MGQKLRCFFRSKVFDKMLKKEPEVIAKGGKKRKPCMYLTQIWVGLRLQFLHLHSQARVHAFAVVRTFSDSRHV